MTADDILADGLREALYRDIESAIHIHMGHDGQSDEANDWVTDLMSAIAPLIERELAAVVLDADLQRESYMASDAERRRAEAEVRALTARLDVFRRHVGDATYKALLKVADRAATADPTPHTDGDTERVFLSCSFCGHWEAGPRTKQQIAEWLRVHKAARLGVDRHGLDRQSTCPHPCGTPLQADPTPQMLNTIADFFEREESDETGRWTVHDGSQVVRDDGACVSVTAEPGTDDDDDDALARWVAHILNAATPTPQTEDWP